jgi:DNA replication protein DnaC
VLTLTSNPAGDERKIMTDFDWSFNPKVPRGACFDLHTLKFVADSDNVLLIGKPGTGKATSPKPSPTTPHCRG